MAKEQFTLSQVKPSKPAFGHVIVVRGFVDVDPEVLRQAIQKWLPGLSNAVAEVIEENRQASLKANKVQIMKDFVAAHGYTPKPPSKGDTPEKSQTVVNVGTNIEQNNTGKFTPGNPGGKKNTGQPSAGQ